MVEVAELAEAADFAAQLEGLRVAGASELDPLRFGWIEALSRRLSEPAPGLKVTVRRRLEATGKAAIEACLAECARKQAERSAVEASKKDPCARSPLAALRRDMAQQVTAEKTPATAGDEMNAREVSEDASPTDRGALKTLRYFRDDWAKLSADQQLAEAQALAPENAGPLNSQVLVLKALQRLNAVSPPYLHRLMRYVDALLWLDQATSAPSLKKTAIPSGGEAERKRKPARVKARSLSGAQ